MNIFKSVTEKVFEDFGKMLEKTDFRGIFYRFIWLFKYFGGRIPRTPGDVSPRIIQTAGKSSIRNERIGRVVR